MPQDTALRRYIVSDLSQYYPCIGVSDSGRHEWPGSIKLPEEVIFSHLLPACVINNGPMATNSP